MVVALLSFVAAAAAPIELDRVAAVVNGQTITLSEARARAQLEATRSGAESQVVLARTLESMINEKLIEQDAVALGIEVTEQDVDQAIARVKGDNRIKDEQFANVLAQQGYTPATYRKFLKSYLAQLKVLSAKTQSKVRISDEDLAAEVQKLKKLAADEFEVRARHILLLTPKGISAADLATKAAEAARLRTAALAPNADFPALAKQYSQDSTAADGGDLGYFGRGVMVPAFERVAYQTPPGQVSEVVRTEFGFHIIKVEARRKIEGATDDEALRNQARDRLTQEQSEKHTAQYLSELRARASIDLKVKQ